MLSGGVKCSTGYQLGTSSLLAVAGSPGTYRVAVKDQQTGLWSEFASAQSYTPIGNFASGSTEASIGSGATEDQDISSPGIVFPDLSMGSGIMSVRRTYVGASAGAWIDEQRSPQWGKSRAAFHVVCKDLDQWQSQLISRFWRCCNGPAKAFFFDYVDPQLGARTTAGAQRYLVRFRDPTLNLKLTDIEYQDLDAVLVEVMSDPESVA